MTFRKLSYIVCKYRVNIDALDEAICGLPLVHTSWLVEAVCGLRTLVLASWFIEAVCGLTTWSIPSEISLKIGW